MLARMVDYIHWSNAGLIAWAREQDAIDAEQIKLLSHILNAADIWIARCQGTEVNKEIFRIHRLEDMAAINDVHHRNLLELIRGDTGRVLDYHLINGSPGRSSLEDVILHVFTHGFHHQGQIAAIASKQGVTPPSVAFITYTRIVNAESPG
jgi:uncharacterized damage-inducible protein DinB